MMSVALPMIMDALMILLLAGTIFYAARLSFHIKAFRDSKTEMEHLLRNLSSQVDQAERAIEGLRENARQAGRDLQQTINEAQAISEELDIITQSGDRLAARLEGGIDKSASKSRPAPSPQRTQMPPKREPQMQAPQPEPRQTQNNLPKPFAGFSIRDPEFEDEGDEYMDENGLMAGDYEDDEDDGFSSQAERDLYHALQNKKRAKAGAGGV